MDQPGFQKRAMPLSVEAWHEMIRRGLAPKRAELIRGVILEKKSKSILHIKLADRLWKLAQAAFGAGFWVRKEDPITTPDSEPEPDLSVVNGEEGDFMNHPTTALWVAEVSVTSLVEDRQMASIYAEAGVQEFWIVNGRDQCIEVMRNPVLGAFQDHVIFQKGDSIPFPRTAPSGGSLEVAALFADLPSADSVA